MGVPQTALNKAKRAMLFAYKMRAILLPVSALLVVGLLFFYFCDQSVYSAGSFFPNPSKIIKTSSIAGSDIGYKINQADEACGSTICEIIVDESGKITTQVNLSADRKLTFQGDNYVFSSKINLNSNNEISGQGVNATIFQRDPSFFAGKGVDMRSTPPDDFNDIPLAAAMAFNINGKSGVVIRNLTIDANVDNIGYYDIEGYTADHRPNGKIFHYPKGAQSEIYILNSSNVNIDGIKLENLNKGGISMIGSSNITIQNSELASNGWNGDTMCFIGNELNHNIVIKNNYMHGASHGAIYLGKVDGAIVEGNNIDSNRQNTYFTGTGSQIGVQYQATNVLIQGNNITNAGHVPASEVPKINMNLIGRGIEIKGTFVTIKNNFIAWNAGGAIWIGDSMHTIWQGDDIYDNDIPDSPAHDIEVSNNTLIENGEANSGQQIILRGDGMYNLKVESNIEK